MSGAAPPTPQSRSELRGDEAVLFARHHQALLRSVRRAVNASDALIEDACSFAWTQLIRSQPDRGPQLIGWLRTVAIHEAYRLSRTERRDIRFEDLQAPSDTGAQSDGWQSQIADNVDLDAALEARRALRTLAQLPERQRRYLTLFAAGYRYQEITKLTGASYTNVNKHLTRARASVRRLQGAA